MEKLFILEGNRKRPAEMVKCDNCNKEFLKGTKYIKRNEKLGHNIYCSKECSQEAQKDRVLLTCSYCGKEFERAKNKLNKSKSGHYFCNSECKNAAQQVYKNTKTISEILPAHYGTGTSNYREIALRELGAVCNRCGYDKCTASLQVHHKNYNHKDNDIDNLEVLCANCHTEEHYGE